MDKRLEQTGKRARGLGSMFVLIWALAACLANQQPATPAPVLLLVPTFTATPTLAPVISKADASIALAPQPTLERVVISPTPTRQPPVTQTVAPLTPSPAVTTGVAARLYTVQVGDTLSGIAMHFQTTVAAIQAANQLTGDLIQPDQGLIIPNPAAPKASLLASPAPTQTLPVQVVGQAVQLSVLEGDLASAYPATLVAERFTLHYAPGTIPAEHPQLLADIITRALTHHEQMLHITLAGRFDAYVAGAPFRPPDQSLRGHSYSAQRYFVFLDDGSGNLDDLTYLAAHELTHMFTWLVFGRPTDPMLSEGAAVYVGMDFIHQAHHMPITTFCAAYSQAGALPEVSAHLRYQGHIRDLENYYAGGCFVRYLIETYGVEKFGKLYPSNDYIGIYGKTLPQLDNEWHAAVAATNLNVPFDPVMLVQMVERLEAVHTKLFDAFTGTAQQMARYKELDPVRMALLEGRLNDVQAFFASQAPP